MAEAGGVRAPRLFSSKILCLRRQRQNETTKNAEMVSITIHQITIRNSRRILTLSEYIFNESCDKYSGFYRPSRFNGNFS